MHDLDCEDNKLNVFGGEFIDAHCTGATPWSLMCRPTCVKKIQARVNTWIKFL